MKKLFRALFLGMFTLMAASASAAHIDWDPDYQHALQKSKETKKPVLLFFTGSGWCSFCNKLEKEVFESPQFADVAQNDYIFVRMDFSPMGQARHEQFGQQHKDLGTKHHVKGFPTVILVDGQEKVLLETGYRPGGAQNYASFLKQNVKGQ